MTKDDVVERVARAIAKANAISPDEVDYFGAPVWIGWKPAARAAIEAMREPTMHMKQEAGDAIVVGCCNLQLRDAEAVWKIMIDAALSPLTRKDSE